MIWLVNISVALDVVTSDESWYTMKQCVSITFVVWTLYFSWFIVLQNFSVVFKSRIVQWVVDYLWDYQLFFGLLFAVRIPNWFITCNRILKDFCQCCSNVDYSLFKWDSTKSVYIKGCNKLYKLRIWNFSPSEQVFVLVSSYEYRFGLLSNPPSLNLSIPFVSVL